MKNRHGIIILTALLLFSVYQLSFADDTGFTSFVQDPQQPALSWSGTGSVTARYMTDYGDISSSSVLTYPKLKLDIEYNGESSQFSGSFNISGNYDFGEAEDISDYLNSLVNEAYFKVFLEKAYIEAGFMKIVWGKGDEVFTFDNINASDYRDFLNPGYMDRKIPETMIKINIPFKTMGLAEILYTPRFTPDKYPSSGYWVQKDYRDLENLITYYGKTPDEIIIPEDTDTLGHGQFGLRITDSLGGFDLGAAYEYTYLRDPVINPTDIYLFTNDPDHTTTIPVTYDRIHLFGLEAAAVFGGFNFRAESAYYLTEDTSGTDPAVHNNRVMFLLGFDRDLPVSSMNINIQAREEIKLKQDGIKDNGTSDIEYSADNTYSSTIIGAELRDTLLNGTLTLKVNGAYSPGTEDYMLAPEAEYFIKDNASVSIKYTMYRGGGDTLFGQFEDNDMMEVVFGYSF